MLIVCLGIVITAPLFFLSLYLYLQQVLGESALRAGLSLLPMAMVLGVGVIVSQRLIPVIGAKILVCAGVMLTAGGLAWLALLPDHPAYLSHLLAPTLVAGCGMSVMLLPMTVVATTGVAPVHAGVASGLIKMGRQIGGALGFAALVTLVTLVARNSRAADAAPVVHGCHDALLAVAVVSLAVTVIASQLKTPPQPPRWRTAIRSRSRRSSTRVPTPRPPPNWRANSPAQPYPAHDHWTGPAARTV